MRDGQEAYLGRDHHDSVPDPESTASASSATAASTARAFNSAEQSYIDPNYFRKLAASQRPSPEGSTASSTPGRGGPAGGGFLQQPAALRSGRSRDVSGSSQLPLSADPPSGAEFVGSEPQPRSNAGGGKGISNDAFSPGFFKQFFVEVGELGRGGNGVVLLVEHFLDSFSVGRFACKRIPVGNDHSWLEKVLIEVKLLQKIPHPNLVAYHWVWLENHQPSKFGPPVPCLWILQEYCNGGDLHDYILGSQHRASTSYKDWVKERKRRMSRGEPEQPQDLRGPSTLTFEEIFSFFRDIASGLHHLHSKNYIHRDLKPSNCLIQRDGDVTKVLLSDFGEVQAAGAKRFSTGATGTISYCAPEVLRRDESDGGFGNFTTKSDIFSLGMIVYFMCFGRLPYRNADDINEENEDIDELRLEITQWTGFDDRTRARPDLPERLYRYLKRLLSVDPNERPSTDEILASIKGGAGLAGDEDFNHHSRVSPIDSPRLRPTSGANKPPHTTFSRSVVPPPIGRKNSNADGRRMDNSPLRRRHSGKHHQSPPPRQESPRVADTSIVVRPRHLDQSPPYLSPTESPHRPHSPRLMLPPPPESGLHATLSNFLSTDFVIKTLRLALFAFKVLSITLPCAPYATKQWILFLLLGLGVLDIGLLPFVLHRSMLLLGFHVTLVLLARRYDMLCEGGIVVLGDRDIG